MRSEKIIDYWTITTFSYLFSGWYYYVSAYENYALYYTYVDKMIKQGIELKQGYNGKELNED